MSVELPTNDSPMDDNVLCLGLPMVADQCHVASEQSILCKPAMYCLASKVATLCGGFNDTSRAKESAVDGRMIVCMDILELLPISRAASKDTMSFWYDRLVPIEHGFEADGTWM